jgi:putative heme-binding domain-containing protein
VAQDQALHAIPDFSQKTTVELAQALNHPNGWQRDMAMSHLWKRHQVSPLTEETLQILRKYAGLQHAPQVRVQALATLGGLNALRPEHLVIALEDPHPGVRVEALRQSETHGVNHPQVLEAIGKIIDESDPKVLVQAAFSLGAWPPSQSEPMLKALASKQALDPLLLPAIQTSLSPESQLFAQLQSQKSISAPVVSTFKASASSGNRAQVIGQYAQVAKLKGDAQKGKTLFQTQCAICHRFRNEGAELGPDLGMASTKTLDWLLTGILDPSLVVEARYRAWFVTLKSDQALTGLIGTETSNNIVLRLPGGQDFPILRSDIQAMKPSSQSLMPEGLEAVLPPQAMADLIAWLQSGSP